MYLTFTGLQLILDPKNVLATTNIFSVSHGRLPIQIHFMFNIYRFSSLSKQYLFVIVAVLTNIVQQDIMGL